MTDPLIRPDPADADIVPPGERAALAKTAAELAVSNTRLAGTVTGLTKTVSFRTRVFIAVLCVDVVLTAAVAVFGYRLERFLYCQTGQNNEFRTAAQTERAAQRRLFDVVLAPASTPADRLKATQDYYAGLVAADQQRTNAAGNC